MKSEVWILGATGRTGSMVAQRLRSSGIPLVLVGRDRDRLQALADELGGAARLVVGTLDEALAALSTDPPGVVFNAIGPFVSTAARVARACPPGTHYLDVSDELRAAEHIFDLDAQAIERGQTLVTGSGFGVFATESVVLRLCEGQPTPVSVRTDAIASVAADGGVVGTALASTIIEVAASGGREVRAGRLVPATMGRHFETVTTPDGDAVGSGSGPTSELLAAWRASGAASVVAASPAIPSSRVQRAAIPVLCALLAIRPLARFAARRVARIPMKKQDRPRASSWGHARVTFASGTVREGWMRAGDGMDFTADIVTEVTRRLLAGEGRPGAHTPGSLFGYRLLDAVGAEFILDPQGF